MSDEANEKDKKRKGDYAEVGFEIGNIEFEAKGKSLVVERMFRLLLDKIEHGRLVATVKLPDYEEEEEEETSDQLEEVATEELEEEQEEEDPLTRTLREIDEAVPPDIPETKDDDESMGDRIPSEAYLEPPPAWDSLDDESPPESDSERDAAED